MPNRPLPAEVLNHLSSGYAINVPAEWQDANNRWWHDPGLARTITNLRVDNGITLHDALWASMNGQPEPNPNADNYSFDDVTQSYTRTDVRV